MSDGHDTQMEKMLDIEQVTGETLNAGFNRLNILVC